MTFEQIVAEHEQNLYRFARRIMRNHEDAEEVVQDTWVRAYRAMTSISGSQPREATLKGWLFTITLNVARNRLREKRLAFVSLDSSDALALAATVADSASLPESIYEVHVGIDRIKQAIGHLPPRLRSAAHLRFLSGKSHREIAGLFSQPVGTVKSQIHRAARILRQRLAA